MAGEGAVIGGLKSVEIPVDIIVCVEKANEKIY
jgi:hypothetical protein